MTTSNERLFRQGVLYAFSRIAPQAIGFLMLPIYARYLGREGYGALSLVTTIGTVMGIVVGQGQAAALFRLKHKYKGEDRQTLIGSIFWYQCLSVGVVCALGFAIGEPIAARFIPEVEFFPLLALGVSGSLLKMLLEPYLRLLQSEQRARLYFVQVTGQAVLSAALGALFIVGLKQGIQGRVDAELLAAAVFFVISIVNLKPGPPWRVSQTMLKETLFFGWPMIWHALSNWVNALSDRIIVNYFLGLAAAGVYSMGYKVASVVSIFGIALNSALTAAAYRVLEPVASDTDAQREAKAVPIRAAARSQLAQVGALGLWVSCLAKEVLVVSSGHAFGESAQVVPLVVAGLIVFAGYLPFPGILAFYGKTRLLPLFSTTAALANVGMNFVFIPRVGIIGAGISTLLSNSLAYVLGYHVSRRWFRCYPDGFLPRFFGQVLPAIMVLGVIDVMPWAWYVALPLKIVVAAGGTLSIARLAELNKEAVLRLLRLRK